MKKKEVIRKKQVALLVSAACLTMGAAHAQVTVERCPSAYAGTIIVGAPIEEQCTVGQGESLNVYGSGSIDTAGPAVAVNTGITAGSIINSGGILSTSANAIQVEGHLNGGIINRHVILGGVDLDGSILSGNTANGIAVINGGWVGGISNESGKTIAAAAAGILADRAIVDGDINNAGQILHAIDPYAGSGMGGIHVTGGTDVYGAIINTGTLHSAYGPSILVENSYIEQGIRNSGELRGSGGILIKDGADVRFNGIVNDSLGSIYSQTKGIEIGNSTASGGILNNGLIEAFDGIVINHSTLVGDIRNNSTIRATRAGIELRNGALLEGDIVNNSRILSQGSAGILVSTATVTGTIENKRIIRTALSGIQLENATVGSIFNSSGSIMSEGLHGVEIVSSAVQQYITNHHQISGRIDGIRLAGSDTDGIRNAGLGQGYQGSAGVIIGNNHGVAIMGGDVGRIENAGTITGNNGSALYLSNAFIRSIENHGLMNSLAQGSGIEVSGSHIGGIRNGSGGVISGYHGIEIQQGMVQAGIFNDGVINGASAGILVSDSVFDGFIINTGAITGINAIEVADASGAVTLINSGLLNGDVLFANGTISLDGSGRITGAIRGAGSTVNVNGTFTTENSISAGAVNVAAGARLNAGHAIAASKGMRNSGTLSVLAVRPFTMTGDYTQTGSGVYQIDANSMTSYGQMTVTGTADLAANANIDVNVSRAATLVADGTLAGVIRAGTLEASSFNVSDNSALFDFEGIANGNNVDLAVRLASTTGVYDSTRENRNRPGANAARVLDSLFASGASGDVSEVVSAFGRLETSKQVSDAVNQTLPLFTGAATTASAGAINTTGRIVQARQEANLGLSAGDGFITDRQMWAKPFGSWARQDNRDGVSGYSANTGGLVIGADGIVRGNDRIGVAFAYANTDIDGNNNAAPQSAEVDTYQALVYGSHGIDERTDLSWQAEIGTNRVDAGRSISFGGLDRRASASYHGMNAHVGAGLGRVFTVNETTNFVPTVRLDYTVIRNEGYTEKGAGALNLDVNSQRTESMVLGADGKVTHQLAKDATLTASLGFGYDLMAERNSITAAYVGGGAAFATKGIRQSPWSVRGGAGVVLHRASGVEVTARYDADVQNSFTNQTLSVKLRKAF